MDGILKMQDAIFKVCDVHGSTNVVVAGCEGGILKMHEYMDVFIRAKHGCQSRAAITEDA